MSSRRPLLASKLLNANTPWHGVLLLSTLLIVASLAPSFYQPRTCDNMVASPPESRHPSSNDDQSITTIVEHTAFFYERTPFSPMSYADLKGVKPSNWGDPLWRYASTLLINHKRVIYCKTKIADCMYRVNNPSGKIRTVVYQPLGNILYRQSNPANEKKREIVRSLTERLEKSEEAVVLVGVGAHGMTGADQFNSCPGSKQERPVFSPVQYDTHNEVVKLLRALQEREQPVFLLGRITEEIVREAGYTYGVRVGCPTLLINKAAHLGRDVLQPRYDALRKRVSDRSLKVAISARNELCNFKAMMKIFETYRNSLIFAQTKVDNAHLDRIGVPFSRVRNYPSDVEGWLSALKEMDVSVGMREHSTMAALAAGIPAVLVVPDFSALELAEEMLIPHIDVRNQSFRTQGETWDIAKMVQNIRFNGKLFDERRCAIAKIYKRELANVGIAVAPHVEAIAGIC